ncbi:MAG TPA: hypothetical protein PK878_12420 [bacterium]|nr:hypothetical protein [Candidatus Omnitrophota bacterium]HOJ61084.1 hypothetical protein [bacterium]HOL95600.1 hypothetical protein [bacterium]HPO99656.1 hypothetical protein [bacterium]HXK95164.1 hypothetical protein [bacterium]
MKGYMQAAEQLIEDLLAEYGQISQEEDPRKAIRQTPNGKLLLDNIEIVFRRSAKHKIFSQRIQNLQSSQLEDSDLLPAYLTTSDLACYHDSLHSLGCSKKICYFLFVTRYDHFGVTERGHYSEILRRQEDGCPKHLVHAHEIKKKLLQFLDTGLPDYAAVQPLVSGYLEELVKFLEAQQTIYQCEAELLERLCSYLNDVMLAQLQSDPLSINPYDLKSLMQLLDAIRKRGVEIPKIQGKLNGLVIQQIEDSLRGQIAVLREECGMIGEAACFLQDILENIETPDQIQHAEDQPIGPTLRSSILEKFSGSFYEWLCKA